MSWWASVADAFGSYGPKKEQGARGRQARGEGVFIARPVISRIYFFQAPATQARFDKLAATAQTVLFCCVSENLLLLF